MDFKSLLDAISRNGEDDRKIEPFDYVSFRILHQMANLLTDDMPKIPQPDENMIQNDSETIIKAYRKSLAVKMENEKQF